MTVESTAKTRGADRIALDAASGDEAELLAAARHGDQDALGVLFNRHAPGARRFAASLSSRIDPDDVVAEAFYLVIRSMRSGGGPRENFGSYLFTAVRRQALNQSIKGAREQAQGEEVLTRSADETVSPLDDGAAVNDVVRRAIGRLPERWRLVLWKSVVEGATPEEIAKELGLKPNTVTSLSYRAREGFRLAMLAESMDPAPAGARECRRAAEAMPGLIRGARGSHTNKLEAHISWCPSCRAKFANLERANSRFHNVSPALIAVGFCSAVPSTTSAAGGTVLTVVGSVFKRAFEFAAHPSSWTPVGSAAVAGGVASVGAVVALAGVNIGGSNTPTTHSQPDLPTISEARQSPQPITEDRRKRHLKPRPVGISDAASATEIPAAEGPSASHPTIRPQVNPSVKPEQPEQPDPSTTRTAPAHWRSTATGRCLTVTDPAGPSRGQLVMQECVVGSPAQSWWYEPSQGLLRIQNAWSASSTPLCAAAEGTWDVAPVRAVPCDTVAPEQSWTYQNKNLVVANSGLCLTVENASREPNATVVVWSCNSGDNETWSPSPAA